MKKYALLLIFSSLIIFQANAHVTLVSPTGGESYTPGQVVTISWVESINHSGLNWDLSFSSDGGMSWTTIQADISYSARSYEWTVPDIETTEGIIKIVQDNPDTDYEDVASSITISATTGISDLNKPNNTSVFPNPFSNQATLEFENDNRKEHSLILYNIQGRIVRKIDNITDNNVVIRKSTLNSGLYFYQLKTNSAVLATGKLLLK